MADFIAFILEIYLDIKHWFRVKKRRKFEKENNLPKKLIIRPITKIWLFLFILTIPILFLRIYTLSKKGNQATLKKIQEINRLLEEEKKQFNKYPAELKHIIRNNPLRKGITLDYWNNEFMYTLSKDSLNYTIISLGRDQKLNSSDDIKYTQKQ